MTTYRKTETIHREITVEMTEGLELRVTEVEESTTYDWTMIQYPLGQQEALVRVVHTGQPLHARLEAVVAEHMEADASGNISVFSEVQTPEDVQLDAPLISPESGLMAMAQARPLSASEISNLGGPPSAPFHRE